MGPGGITAFPEDAPPPASRASDPRHSAPSWKGPVLTPGLSHSRTMSFCLSFHLPPPPFSVFLQMQSAPTFSLHLWRSLSGQDGWGSSRCSSAKRRWARWLSLEGKENLNFLSNSYIDYILKWSYLGHTHGLNGASLVAQLVKNLPAMRETWVQFLGWEDPLEKGKATHSSSLAWRIPWTV